MLEMTKRFCDSFLEAGLPGFDLAVYKDGKPLLRHFNGYSDLENKVKMKGDERYFIYSCSKPITCVAAMQLWEKGLFSLDDELSRYMPEFENMTVKTGGGVRPARNPILVKHLFEMTAGFSYALASPELVKAREETDGRCPTREVMKYLAKEPLLFDPGERWEYSLCHDVLAALVEVISGEKFEDYVEKNIFRPLGMTHSTFMLPDSELPTVSELYSYSNGETHNDNRRLGYKIGSEYASGGAGCISTVDDYMKFLEALRTGDGVLKKETIDLMATDRLTDEQKRTYWTRATHGYGLGLRCPKNGGAYPDFGWGGAACAFLAVDRPNGLSVYFGAHMRTAPVHGLRSMIYRLVRAELFAPEEMENVQNELSKLHDYNLTY